MNTSLQCLSSCYELSEYFLKDLYKAHINKDNPIGTGGDLAMAYAFLLKNLWYGSNKVHSPWNFKRAISGFQNMFSGYLQHDTQEFLNYLLDGLHEDLNKVLQKPLVDKDDSKNPDEIKSEESWKGFLKRNQSLLVDLFYGQYKSTLYCPNSDCQNISTCFDPFLSISLPLISKTETYELKCFFIYFDIEIKPLQLDIQFSSETTIMALRNKVSKILQIHPFSFLIVKFENLSTFEGILSSKSLLRPYSYQNTGNNRGRQFFLFQIDPQLYYNCSNNKYFFNCNAPASSAVIGGNSNNADNISKTLKDPRKKDAEYFVAHNLHRSFKTCKSEIEQNKEILNELFDDDYEEDETGATKEEEIYYSKSFGKVNQIYKVFCDENYGLTNDWIKVVIYLKKFLGDFPNIKREILSFPRILYLNKSWTLRYVHKYIFNYIANLIRIGNEEDQSLSKEELYKKYFSKQLENFEKDFAAATRVEEENFAQNPHLPFFISISNNSINSNYGPFNPNNDSKICYYCERPTCAGCLLPNTEEISLKDLLSKVPRNENDMEIDNTYLYLHERYKNVLGMGNRDFCLEIGWRDSYSQAVRSLLEKEEINFKVQKHDREDGISIIECFKNFSKLEKLEADNEWFCSDCKNHVRATKKMEIYNSPNILIIHLKRFKNNSKIDTLVNFPLEGLDISDFVINKKINPQTGENEKYVYDLFAVANHFGSINFGHYTAYAKNYFTNKWYDFDDSHVSYKNEDDIVSPSAYVLFYKRQNLSNFINLSHLYTKKFINFNCNNNNSDCDTNIMTDSSNTNANNSNNNDNTNPPAAPACKLLNLNKKGGLL